MGPFVLDKRVKLDDPSFNRSREIPPEAVGGSIFYCFPYNFQTEVDNDVISGTAVDNVGVDVAIKFGDSRSNGFRDIRGAGFVSNERTLAQACPNSAKRFAFRLKTVENTASDGFAAVYLENRLR